MFFLDQINNLLYEGESLANSLNVIDETLLELAQIATSSASVINNSVEIKIILSNKTFFSRNELNIRDNSELTVYSLELDNDNSSVSSAIVIAKLTTSQILQQKQGEDANGFFETLLGIPGSSFLSINAFDKINNKKLTASVDYSKTTPNASLTLKNALSSQNVLSERKVVQSFEYSCQYLNGLTFLTSGCTTNNSEGSKEVTCSCDHTTIFSILLSVNYVEIPAEVRVSVTD